MASEAPPQLVAGKAFTVQFPEMPPTFYGLIQRTNVKAQMTVFLPVNYDPTRKHPLLVFLNGGDGGPGANPGVARALTQQRDFICVSMPLFKSTNAPLTGSGYIMTAPDGQYMWPFFKTMLTRLETLVPNIDRAHQLLGGFSNGAHAIAALLDESEGQVARQFSAVFFVEGGGKLRQYELLKDKPFLMVSSNAKSRPRAEQIRAAAQAAGARATLVFEDVGKHDFPAAAYPAVRAWLNGPARN